MLIAIAVTCKNKAEAEKIARRLLQKRLIACANFWPVESRYWWRKKMVRSREILLVCKTLSKNISPVKKSIIAAHSYQTPVITVEKVQTTSAVVKWARQEIK
jgi:periplasmic divalent cation tolerance protein